MGVRAAQDSPSRFVIEAMSTAPLLALAPKLAFKALMRGDAAPAIVAGVAAFIVRYIVLPLYETRMRAYTPAFSAKLPAPILDYYNPTRDHAFNMMLLSALLGFGVMSLVLCSFLDLFPSATARFKVCPSQGDCGRSGRTVRWSS